MLNKSEVEKLQGLAKEVRIAMLTAMSAFGVGHIGGSLSIAESLVYLYYKEMKTDPKNPLWADRDRFVLSKGHSGPALYGVLAMKGYFPYEELKTLNQSGTRLPSHCDRVLTPGIDMTAGSLGQGLSAAVGMAIAAKIDKKDYRTYCIIGDGESQEGQIWEACMTAAQQRLDNLVVILDDNGMQLDDYTDNVMSIRDAEKRWQGFGFATITVDGHNFQELNKAFQYAKHVKGRPTLIHMLTVKGKGVSMAEGILSNHNMPVSQEAFEKCVQEIQNEVYDA